MLPSYFCVLYMQTYLLTYLLLIHKTTLWTQPFIKDKFFREVCVDEGQQLSLAHGCQFYEVSAAESPAGAALAFQALLREARSVQLLRALPIRRKLGVHSVSRVLGTIFGKNTTKERKKRPSLSIWRLLSALLFGGREKINNNNKRNDIVVLSSNVYKTKNNYCHVPNEI